MTWAADRRDLATAAGPHRCAAAALAFMDRRSRGAVYWFGTDSAGLDIFSRVLAAPRADVAIALGANIVSLIMGSLLGLAAGFSRNWIGRSSCASPTSSRPFRSSSPA